jgi:hypothetical protein
LNLASQHSAASVPQERNKSLQVTKPDGIKRFNVDSQNNAHVVVNETKEFLCVSLGHGHAMQFIFTRWKMTVGHVSAWRALETTSRDLRTVHCPVLHRSPECTMFVLGVG